MCIRDRPEVAVSSQKMSGKNPHTDERCGSCGKGGTYHAKIQRINEKVIQQDIGEASDDHSCHG